MKIIIKIIGTFLAIVILSATSDFTSEDLKHSNNILRKIKNLAIDDLLDFKKMSMAIEDDFDKEQFHYIIAYEIERRKKELDRKFINQEIKYQKAILSYEDSLSLIPFQYVDKRPRFDHIYQNINISEEPMSNDIHRVQADLARTQFIHSYKYYPMRLENYNNYLSFLHELYKYKVIENKENQIEYYSNFPKMYQSIKLTNNSMDDARKMKVYRDILGKVLYIDWQLEDENNKIQRRYFEYFDDGLLSKLTDKINDEVVSETLFGETELGIFFFEKIFSPGFIPMNYNYYTEVFYQNNRPSTHKLTSMNGHIIGTIYKEYDEKEHLIRETWFMGETNNILREFTSKFDSKSGGYKLIERDHNSKIVNQEIVLSSNN